MVPTLTHLQIRASAKGTVERVQGASGAGVLPVARAMQSSVYLKYPMYLSEV